MALTFLDLYLEMRDNIGRKKIIMTNALKLTTKAFTWSVVVATIAWSVGLAALMPHSAQAATCPDAGPGDLVKFEGTTSVYVLNANMERVYFPNSEVFHQYFVDFSSTLTAPISCSDLWPTPGPGDQAGVTVRAGSRLVKSMVSSKVYVVAPGGMIHWVSDGDMLSDIYGSSWPGLYDIHDFHRANYVDGADWDGSLLDGWLISEAGSSDVYFVDGGERHMVDGAVPSPVAGDVHEVSASVMASISDSGSTVTPATVSQVVLRTGTVGPGPGPLPSTGDLSLSLSPSSPASTIVPAAATHVPYLVFRAHNTGSTSVVLEELEAERYGLGDDANFDRVWLEVGGASVSNEQSVGSDDSVILRPDYTIPAGGFVDFTLVGNLSVSDTSFLDGFRVVSASMVDAGGATVGGSFPISGNLMSYSNFSVGTATIDERGSDADIDGGDDSAVVGEFDLDWSSDNDNSGVFMMLRLKQDGTANMSELSDWELYHDGSMLSATVSVWGDYVTWVLPSGLVIEDGDTERFEVRVSVGGDIDDEDTVKLVLDDTRDVHVQDMGVTFGGSVTNDLDANSNANELFEYTVDAGQLTVTRDTSNPTSESYAQDTKDVVALVAKVDLGQKVQVDGLRVYLHQDSTIVDTAAAVNADIERAELWKNDSKIGTLTSVSGTALDTNGTYVTTDFNYNFNNSFTLEDDDLLTVMLDLENDAATTHTYKFVIDSGAFDDPEYVSNTTDVDDGDLSGSATGSDVAIAAASVTITRNDGIPSGENFIAGASDQLFFQFLVDVGTASGIELRTLNFDMENDDADWVTDNDTFFRNFYLMEEGATERFSDLEDMTSAGALNFTSLNTPIGANEQMVIGLYGTIESGAAATSAVTFDLDTSDSDIDDENGADVTGLSATYSSQSFDVAAGGLLTVTADNSGTPDAEVVTSNNMQHLATFRLDADDSDVGVTDLYFANNNTTSAANTADSDADFLVYQYHLFVGDESTARESSAPSNGRVHFEMAGSDRIIVEDDAIPLTVEVWGELNDITDVSQTGQEFDIHLYAVEAITEGPDTALALDTGVTTTAGSVILVSDAVTSLDSAVSGNEMFVAKSVPTLTREDVSTVLNNAPTDVYSFTVSADANGSVTWDQIVLEIDGDCDAATSHPLECMTNTSWEIYDSGDNALGVAMVSSSNRLELNLTTLETVSAGDSATYRVEATLVGFADGDSFTVRVKDTTTNTPLGGEALSSALTTAAFTGPFVWSDNSGSYESTTDAHWFTGRNLDIDTTKQSIEKSS